MIPNWNSMRKMLVSLSVIPRYKCFRYGMRAHARWVILTIIYIYYNRRKNTHMIHLGSLATPLKYCLENIVFRIITRAQCIIEHPMSKKLRAREKNECVQTLVAHVHLRNRIIDKYFNPVFHNLNRF